MIRAAWTYNFFSTAGGTENKVRSATNYLEILCWWVWMIAKELVKKLGNWRGIWVFQRLPNGFGKRAGWVTAKWMLFRLPLGRRWLAVDHYNLSFSVRPTRMNENPARGMILNAFSQTHRSSKSMRVIITRHKFHPCRCNVVHHSKVMSTSWLIMFVDQLK